MSNLVERDLATVWHPCTQMKDHEEIPLVPIVKGQGIWLYDENGKKYLDAVSSWWVNLFGHAHPAIADRIGNQAHLLEHVLLAGATHPPAVELAERLVSIAPHGLTKVFYADIGSAAVEVALKMSHHFWRNTGRPEKKKFIALSGGYHGETLGALGVGDLELYRTSYSALMHEAIIAPSPDTWNAEPGESGESFAKRMAHKMEEILAQHHHEVAAIIVEPLVQCAGGMRMYHPIYLSELRKLCDAYQVHLIADEIAVGFGRTGTMFACEQANISPDFLCLSKGITAGFLPLAAVMMTDDIYQAFYDDYAHIEKAFLHSHSYTGNPIACAAGLATLDVFEQDCVIEENQKRVNWMREASADFIGLPHVGDVRQTGMVVAIELVQEKPRSPYPWDERRGILAYRKALEMGCWLRPLGSVLYWMPPYIISEEEIGFLADVTKEAILVATRD